jgi:hypothetical protein
MLASAATAAASFGLSAIDIVPAMNVGISDSVDPDRVIAPTLYVEEFPQLTVTRFVKAPPVASGNEYNRVMCFSP